MTFLRPAAAYSSPHAAPGNVRLAAVLLMLAIIGPPAQAGRAAEPARHDDAPAPSPTKAWPFQSWAYAKAYTFNFFPYRRAAPLHVYSEPAGWSPHIHSQRPITRAHGEQAARLVQRTQGAVEVSKCAFPRHAVVWFDAADQPVASVGVCFECGDILVWPPFFKDAQERHAKYHKVNPASGTPRVLEVYDQVYPQWQTLFIKELRLPQNGPWKTTD